MRTVLDPFITGYRVEFTDYDQVSDVIDGKRVLGPPQDIREVQNAYEAYEIMTRLNPYSVKDLLKAHKIMMEELVKEAGVFRSKGVGVYSGEQLIHAGTPANYVLDLIGQLFEWLNKSKLHPLVKSCISIMSLSLFILLQTAMEEREGFGILWFWQSGKNSSCGYLLRQSYMSVRMIITKR